MNQKTLCWCHESTGALSSMFYLAYEFHDDPTGGILANTNCGGQYTSFKCTLVVPTGSKPPKTGTGF